MQTRVPGDLLSSAPRLAWALTSGEAGMRTQARGLAAALAAEVQEKTTPPKSDAAALLLATAGRPSMRTLQAPWPDLLVSCGRRSIPYALEVKRRSAGATRIIHVQDPRRAASRFDFVVAMEHDRIGEGDRVIKVATALHDLTPAILAEAAASWRPSLKALGPRLCGVLIGGDLNGRPFENEDCERLLRGLERLRRSQPCALAITPSRRTPPAFRERLSETFRDDPSVFLWDLTGENPYRTILGASDALVVTGDSVSMISEAISTTAPVDVLDLGFRRHIGFMNSLVESGRVRRFAGEAFPLGPVAPVNATLAAAEAARRRLSCAQPPTG